MASSACATTILEFSPDELQLDENETFTVTFLITPDGNIDTVASDMITWDPGVLKLTKVEHGDLFNPWLVWINGTIDNTRGEVEGIVGASNNETNKSGIWIILTFKSIGEGETDINVEHLGVALGGFDVDREMEDFCHIKVGEGSPDPPSPPPGGGGGGGSTPPEDPPQEEPEDNETEPEDNETQPPENNETQPPEQNETQPPENNETELPDEPLENDTENTIATDEGKTEEGSMLLYPFIGIISLIIAVLIIGIIFAGKQIEEEEKEDIFNEDEDEQEETEQDDDDEEK